jgi:hypothetical protein
MCHLVLQTASYTSLQTVPAALSGIDKYLNCPLIPTAIAELCPQFFATQVPLSRDSSTSNSIGHQSGRGKKKGGRASHQGHIQGGTVKAVPDLTIDDVLEVCCLCYYTCSDYTHIRSMQCRRHVYVCVRQCDDKIACMLCFIAAC